MVSKKRCSHAMSLAATMLLAVACTTQRSRTTAAGAPSSKAADFAALEVVTSTDDGGPYGPDSSCQPQEETTMLGFGLQPIGFDDCDQAVRRVASLPIDRNFLAAVTSPDGLAKCTASQHCSLPDSTGEVTADPNGPTCQSVIDTYLPPHIRGTMLPGLEIVRRTGCPGVVPTCVVSHGAVFGGDYAFGPASLTGLVCPGPGGTATSATTTQVLQIYGYADATGTPVDGLPSSVSQLANTIGQDYCSFANSPAGDDGGADGGSDSSCGQYSQYASAYGTGLSMGAGQLAGNSSDETFISNLVASALHAASVANVAGVDCSQLGLTRQYNLLGFPILETTGDGNDGGVPGADGAAGNGGGYIQTTALPDLFQLAFATRIGTTNPPHPDLSPNGVAMSTFAGSATAGPLYPYTGTDQVPTACVDLEGDTRIPLDSTQEYSGTLGSPNWVQVIPVGSFSFTVSGVTVGMVLALTDPCCNPSQNQ
jgi:hypothetical protein